MGRSGLLFALLAVSLFFNAYLLARSQNVAAPAPTLLTAKQLDLTADQALALESIRRYAAIRAARRAERQSEPLAVLQDALVDLSVSAEAVNVAVEELGTIDAQYRVRLIAELSKWSETLGPPQRSHLQSALAEQGLDALVEHWE